MLAEFSNATGIGTDVSAAALDVARRNSARLDLTSRVDFRRTNWAEDVAGRFDLIVSNPPYISAAEMDGLSADVRDWEPYGALSLGGDGLDAYRAILPDGVTRLTPNGRLLLEIGYTQGEAVSHMARGVGYRDVRVLPDIDGRDRVVAMLAPKIG